MDAATVETLLRLNRGFYARFAAQFAETRAPEQPGLERLLPFLPEQGRLLDVGCGNGRFARLLDLRQRSLAYVGVDSSPDLLAIAQAGLATSSIEAHLVAADLLASGWTEQLPPGRFDAVVALAVLHHIPGWQNRCTLMAQLDALLAEQGVLALSTWQFLASDRLRRKIVPWSAAGLSADQVEPGDYLLDWRRGGVGLRYCHLVDEQELMALAQQAGLQLQAAYRDDGQGGRLNLFAVLRAAH